MSYQHLKQLIRTIPDFPKAGIQFRDITTLLSDGPGFQDTIEELAKHYENETIDFIIGIEARGFILGAPLAVKLGIGFVPLYYMRINGLLIMQGNINYALGIFGGLIENASKKVSQYKMISNIKRYLCK